MRQFLADLVRQARDLPVITRLGERHSVALFETRYLLKLTGSYMLPYQVLFGANVRWQSGLPYARTFTVASCTSTVVTNCVAQGNTTILAEPRGSRELPSMSTVDLRAGRFFTLGRHRLELRARPHG